MKRALVLGAGQSTPFLIGRLLEEPNVAVTVADRDIALAERRVGGHPRGAAALLDANDAARLGALIGAADVVVNLLTPPFQVPVAERCVELGRSMVSASYRSPGLLDLDAAARARGIGLWSELGLDPGLDHLSATRLLGQVRADGAIVRSLSSYGSGVAERGTNPFGYAITWNPRNVVMAGLAGARLRVQGQTKVIPYPEVLRRTWPVDVPGVGPMEAYANRDSLSYLPLYGVEEARTMIRATLRHPGFCEAWWAVAALGLANEEVQIPDLPGLRWRQLVEVFLAPGERGREGMARALGLHPGATALDRLEWLGLFSEERIADLAPDARTPAEALARLLSSRLALPEGSSDLVILHHEVLADGPDGPVEYLTTLVERGMPGKTTAMAKTVGLPAAIAAIELLRGPPAVLGCPIPTEAALVERLLPAVEAEGLRFIEQRGALRGTGTPG